MSTPNDSCMRIHISYNPYRIGHWGSSDQNKPLPDLPNPDKALYPCEPGLVHQGVQHVRPSGLSAEPSPNVPICMRIHILRRDCCSSFFHGSINNSPPLANPRPILPHPHCLHVQLFALSLHRLFAGPSGTGAPPRTFRFQYRSPRWLPLAIGHLIRTPSSCRTSHRWRA
jgi:hypothetical protein